MHSVAASSISTATLNLHYPTPAPRDRKELANAVDIDFKGNWNNDLYTWMVQWDVSRVADMSTLFKYPSVRDVTDFYLFNADISEWDVSKVTDMKEMFMGAASFNANISEWDVSRVTSMVNMFNGAQKFYQKLSGAWSTSKADKSNMFHNSGGEIVPLHPVV